MWTTEKLVEWEKALRSGEYEMTRGVLATNNVTLIVPRNEGLNTATTGYCCLGVACEVLGLESWINADSHTWSYQGPVLDGDRSFPYEYQDVENTALPSGTELPYGGGINGELFFLTTDGPVSSPRLRDRRGITVSLSQVNDYVPDSEFDHLPDAKAFTQDQIADLVHWFFVIPAQRYGFGV